MVNQNKAKCNICVKEAAAKDGTQQTSFGGNPSLNLH